MLPSLLFLRAESAEPDPRSAHLHCQDKQFPMHPGQTAAPALVQPTHTGTSRLPLGPDLDQLPKKKAEDIYLEARCTSLVRGNNVSSHELETGLRSGIRGLAADESQGICALISFPFPSAPHTWSSCNSSSSNFQAPPVLGGQGQGPPFPCCCLAAPSLAPALILVVLTATFRADLAEHKAVFAGLLYWLINSLNELSQHWHRGKQEHATKGRSHSRVTETST